MTSATEAPRTDASTGPFLRNFLASFSSHLAVFLFLLFPTFLRERGATETVIGVALSVPAFTSIAARPVVGRIMDTLGRRHALIAGGLLHTLASGLYLTVDGPGVWMLLVRALHGIAGGFFFSAAFAIASDLADEATRAQRLALFGISGILPMSLSSVLGAFAIHHGGFGVLFALAALLAFVGLAIAMTVPETGEPSASIARGGMTAALTVPGLPWLFLTGFFFAAAICSYFGFVANFAAVHRIGQVSTFFTPYAVVAVLVRVFFGSVPDRLGERVVFPPAILVLASGLVCLAFANGPAFLGIAGGLCGLGHALGFPSLFSLFVKRSPREIRGSVVAAFTALMDVGPLLATPAYGRIADAFGHRWVFGVAAVFAALSVTVFIARGRNEPATVEAPAPVD